MSKAKENLPMEAMAEIGEASEAAANITPPPPPPAASASASAAIQRARASLLLSSLRHQATLADPDTEDMVELRRQVVDLSAEICSQRHWTERSLHLKNLQGILGFVSFCLFLLLVALE